MSSSGPARSLHVRLAKAFAACGTEAAAYGACVSAALPASVVKDACATPFAALSKCAARAAAGGGKGGGGGK